MTDIDLHEVLSRASDGQDAPDLVDRALVTAKRRLAPSSRNSGSSRCNSRYDGSRGDPGPPSRGSDARLHAWAGYDAGRQRHPCSRR